MEEKACRRNLREVVVPVGGGIHLGVEGGTGEVIVSNKHGVQKTSAMHRRPKEYRWTKGNLSLIDGVPWRTSAEDPNANGELAEGMTINIESREWP